MNLATSSGVKKINRFSDLSRLNDIPRGTIEEETNHSPNYMQLIKECSSNRDVF